MKQIKGIAAARGFAIGPVFQFQKVNLHLERYTISKPDDEVKRLDQAVVFASMQVQAVYEKAKAEMATDPAAIFDTHMMMLQDPELLNTIRKTITEQKLNAEFAIKEATEHYAQTLEGMGSEYFQSRAADVRDIAERLLRILMDVSDTDLSKLTEPSIIVAKDLTPSDTVLFKKQQVLGFFTVEGSETSHTAILARELSIPAVVRGGSDILSIPNGCKLVLDGTTGKVFISPTAEIVEMYKAKKTSIATEFEIAFAHCQEPAVTRDGYQVEVVANIGSVEGAKTALENGAEGVGLLRTEFLYMERKNLPDEEEQYKSYSAISEVFGMLPIVLRTSDIGGDKDVPYLDLAKEMNPFLGLRGLRLALSHPKELLKPQLKAALRAGKGHDLRIMFPMVATLAEIHLAKKIVDECSAELLGEGKSINGKLQLGIMVEVPSAALMADKFAPEVDFFSIGTNDLTQYTLAVDRTNPQLAYLASAFSPAVLRLIQNVIVQAHKYGKWVGLCGELAGEPLAIPVLLGLGLDEFSMNPSAIPTAKEIIRGLIVPECQDLAEEILKFESAEEVISYVREKMPKIASY